MAQYVCCVEFLDKTDNWCGKEEHYEGQDIQKKLNIEEVYGILTLPIGFHFLLAHT